MRRRRFLASVGAAGTATLAGCTADGDCPPADADGVDPGTGPWPQVGGTPDNVGMASNVTLASTGVTAEFALHEHYPGDTLVLSTSGPVVGEHVYVAAGPREDDDADEDGVLFAVSDPHEDGADGLAWTATLPDGVAGGPALLGDLVLASAADGTVRAFDATDGDERWRADIGPSPTALSVGGGRIYVGDGRGVVTALSVDGEACWSAGSGVLDGLRGLVSDTPWIAGRPALTDDRVYSVRATGDSEYRPEAGVLLALDRTDGETIWEYEFDPGGQPVRTPSVAVGTVYLPGGAALHAVDREGTRRWRWVHGHRGAVSTPAIADGVLYASARNLYALDAEDGAERWRLVSRHHPSNIRTASLESAPVVVGDRVVAALGVADRETGDRLGGDFGDDPESRRGWNVPGYGPTETGPAVGEDRVYVATDGGVLYEIGGPDHE